MKPLIHRDWSHVCGVHTHIRGALYVSKYTMQRIHVASLSQQVEPTNVWDPCVVRGRLYVSATWQNFQLYATVTQYTTLYAAITT